MSLVKTMIMVAAAMVYVNIASAQSTVVFDFATQAAIDALDDQINASFTVDGVTLITGATGPEFSGGMATGNDTALQTSISVDFDGNPTILAIDNQTISDDQFDDLFPGDTNEDAFISFNEILNISFDTDVVIDELDFFGVGNTETVTAVVDGGGSFDFVSNTNGDIIENPFGAGTTIEAGTNISFSIANDAGDEGARYGFNDITVTTVAAVPEPSSIALLGLGGSLMLARRRRILT